MVKQQEEFHNTKIYVVDSPTGIHKQNRDMVDAKAPEKNQLGHFLPQLKSKSSSPTYTEVVTIDDSLVLLVSFIAAVLQIPRSPFSAASVDYNRHFIAWERGGSPSPPSSPIVRRANTLSGIRRPNTLSGIANLKLAVDFSLV